LATELVLVDIRIIEAPSQALAALVSYQDVSVEVEHLVLDELGRKHAVLIHGYLMHKHDNLSI